MDHLERALDAVKQANDALAAHAARAHRACAGCMDVSVVLLVAQESIEYAMGLQARRQGADPG
jgi:hypothetical protein